MSRRGWIVTLVVGGLALAIVIGVLANSQSVQEGQYCDSLEALESSLTSLTALDPNTASADQVQSDINSVQNDWGDVKTDAQNLHDSNQQALNTAWNSFQKAVGDLKSNGSTADVQNAAKGLASAAQSSVDSYHCTTSSSGTSSSGTSSP